MISDQVKLLKGSPTIEYFSLAKKREAEGHDIIHLGIGQPDFQPPQSIIDATIQAIKQGKTTYTVSPGIIELRQAISQAYNEDYKLNIEPSEVIITSGAKQAILAAVISVLDRGDHLIVPEPRWVSYPDMASVVGAKYIPVPMMDDFSLNQEEILSKMNNKAKAMILNSPNNPSGHVLTQEEIKFLQDLIEDHNIFIISDEIYNEYIFNAASYRTLMTEFEDWRENLIVINGFSKTFSMTGYRLGYTISNSEIMEKGILKFIQVTTTCPSSFCQWGAVTALQERADVRKMIDRVFKERREVILKEIEKTEGITVGNIDGAFYGFLKYSFTDKSSKEVTKDLLIKANVSVIPGSVFGDSAEGYLRVTFARSIPEIQEAFNRIRTYLNQ